jgi:hypothetical protein
MIVQFNGENRKDAIINHFSLDVSQEVSFFEYIQDMGYDENSDDDILESLMEMWRKNLD